MRKEVAVAIIATAASVAAIAILLRKWKLRKEWQFKKTQCILRKFARDCATPVSKLWQIADDLGSEMRASLSSNEAEKKPLNFRVSYTDSLPFHAYCGYCVRDEKGMYYGVTLRGTNFLILCARLGGKNEPILELRREEIPIPSNVMAGNSEDLLEFIAMEVAIFVSAHPETDTGNEALQKESILGFTVSYPVDEASTCLGNSIKWKSFSVDDTVGKNLVNSINRSREKHGVHLRVLAVVDETIGDLAGGRYYNKDSVAAITLGMGINAAYIEPAESGEMVITMGWENFTSGHLPITEFDSSLDSESSNPGSGIFQKLISGIYLGEIVRRILLKMAMETGLFGDCVPPKLEIPYLLKSPDMASMHQDTSENRDLISKKLEEIFGITGTTPMARQVAAEVCDMVSERGARLAGAGIVGIVKKIGRMEEKRSVVIVEGGLYEHYRVFRNYLNSSIWEMLGNDVSDNLIIQYSHGGSGTGALFLASSQVKNSGE